MSTEPVPAKHHQPLHNFSLPFLKWGQRLQINHHCRRRNGNRNNNRNSTGNGNGNGNSSDSDHNHSTKPHRSRTEHAKTKIDERNGDVFVEKRNNKLSDADVATAVEGDAKPWNLRPRRFSITGDGSGAAGCSVKSRRMVRGVGDSDGVAAGVAEEKEEDRKKRRLWISLSKEEIEEDIYAFTGSKPARRPKKRNRTVQKLLDNVFPGLDLVGISADSYRV